MNRDSMMPRACLPLLPEGEGSGMRVLRLGEGAQHKQTISRNATEILEA